MHLYKTTKGNILHAEERYYLIRENWDTLINREDLYAYLHGYANESQGLSDAEAISAISTHIQAPIGSQEVWAAGVTYLKSRDARMEESQDSGAADCYQRVYEADRPELFFKSLPHRVAGPNEAIHIRKDSSWDVPEPELTLFINSKAQIQAYTIGNDMSSRSIEGENPLYLPQAKMYERSAALGPCLLVPEKPIDASTTIGMVIQRNGETVFDDGTSLDRMKRSLPDLAAWLCREMDFHDGVFLMTGTCVVPDPPFTLQPGDKVHISIEGIGTLSNIVARGGQG